jgi:uncharacterized membrane protein YedE/YeeE
MGISIIVPTLILLQQTVRVKLVNIIISFLVGMLFGTGLIVSGMTDRFKIAGFLDLGGNWDPSLIFVLFAGVLFNFGTFNLAMKIFKKPLLDDVFYSPKGKVDDKLIIGSILFGIGWGLGSMCPGPLYMNLSTFQLNIQGMWLIGCILGMFVAEPQVQKDKNH